MSDSLRILTYNTQMRSALMEMGFPPSIPPVYNAPERARTVARRILDSPTVIDVVCLNEIFDEPARNVLSDELAGEFPYQVVKADTFHTRVRTPSLLDDLPEELWSLTLGPVTDVVALAMAKLEDSGLFLASRLPFAHTEPSEDALQVLASLGLALPDGLPRVRFQMYRDSSDMDKFAAKGVLYARLTTPGGEPRHVFMSHAQADSERTGENVGDRRKQMQDVADFIELCVEDGHPFDEEVFFLGDLNVEGHGALDDVEGEWQDLFLHQAGPLSPQLVDRWGSDECQCPGGSSGRTDPGFTADVVYPPYRQRLDYFFSGRTTRLAVQHLRVAREIGDPQGATFLSDHQPLLADLNATTSFCTPADPRLVDPQIPNFSDSGSLVGGQVRWYRFDVAGTYDVKFTADGSADHEVYVGDDFSTPQPTYREMVSEDGLRRFVLVAPFFIKVFTLDRDRGAFFELQTHRHDGRSLDDAIVLIPGVRHVEWFPNQPFNGDSAHVAWDDSESKWFLVQTPRVEVPGDLRLTATIGNASVESSADGVSPTDVRLTVGELTGSGSPVPEISSSFGGSSSIQQAEVAWVAGHQRNFVVLVQRQTGTSNRVVFDIVVDTNLSVLVTRPALDTTLTCREETSGWGADDIALQLWADGTKVAEIPNAVIGDFEDGSVRTVGDKLPALIPYVDRLEVMVIEEDIDADDVGVGTLPVIDRLAETDAFAVVHTSLDGRVKGSLLIGVDDGKYGLACVVSRWHPSL